MCPSSVFTAGPHCLDELHRHGNTLDCLFSDAAESETEVDHMKPSNPHLDREINMSGLFTFYTDACQSDACQSALDRERNNMSGSFTFSH